MQFACDEDYYQQNLYDGPDVQEHCHWNKDGKANALSHCITSLCAAGICIFGALPDGHPPPAQLSQKYLSNIKKTKSDFEKFRSLDDLLEGGFWSIEEWAECTRYWDKFVDAEGNIHADIHERAAQKATY